MQTITHLVSGAAEADVFERGAPRPAMDPIAEDTLIRFAELTRAGHHSATIDPHREAESRAVFERDLFAGQLAHSVERYGSRGGKFLGHAVRTGRRRCFAQDERAILLRHGQGAECGDRIDATRAEQDETGVLAFAEFEQVDCAPQIVFEQFLARRFAINPRKHAGIGRRVDHPINTARPLEISLLTHITAPEFNARLLDARLIELAARSAEIVEPAHLVPRAAQSESQFRSDKPANAADQDVHGSQPYLPERQHTRKGGASGPAGNIFLPGRQVQPERSGDGP